MLFTGLAFFTKAVPTRTKALWKNNGGKIVQMVPEFFEATSMFCAGGHDPELSELLARQIIVRDVSWIEACIAEDFLMPTAAYTLDEDDLVHTANSADLSMDSNSSSMTIVDHAFSELPAASNQYGARQPDGSFKTILVGRNAPFKIVHARKGALTKRLGGRRSRSASSSVSRATPFSRNQKQRQSRFPSRSLALELDKSVKKTAKARVVLVESKPSRSAVNTGDGAPHFDADLSSGQKMKSQIPRGQSFGMAEPADTFREFCSTVPKVLRRSVEFQDMLKRAVETALDREAKLRLEPTAWKGIQAEGTRQSDGSLHISVEHLLQHPSTDVVDLNIGDVFKGRRFRISNAEALVS